MKTLLLIDANSLIHRCFHALPPLTTPEGKPIQAIYGLSSILLKLFREERPDYAAALFDRPEPTFRKEKYKEYKAQRPAAPDELISQIIEAHALFEKFGIKTFEAPGYEADDLIATFAENFKEKPDLKVVILTGDLDTLQLVEDDKMVVRTFKKGISDTFVYNEQAVMERYGLRPDQLVDYKALVGDPSDNIKGVPGVGPKTASQLLKEFGTLENVYKNVGRTKIAEKLTAHREDALLSKNLVTLEREAPVSPRTLDNLMVGREEGAADYFRALGFESLLERLEKGIKGKKKTPAAPPAPAPPSPSPSFDEETLFIEEGGGWRREYELSALKVGFDLKRLLKRFLREDKNFSPPYWDLGVAFWLLDPDCKDYTPSFLAKKFLRREWSGSEDDLRLALEFSRAKLAEYHVTDVFRKIEMPTLRVLAEVENWGVAVNPRALQELEKKIEKKLAELAAKIYAEAGEEFNINSPQQLGRILFEKLAAREGKTLRKTPTGRLSTNAENLAALRGDFPIVSPILEYRDGFKTLSTYVRPFRGLAEDGRLHTEFIQTGTATGRISSREPNLQNIPQESVWAAPLRNVFGAPENFSLLALDYSQIELRILAALSQDPKLMGAFRKNFDIHRATAARVLKISADEVTPERRRLAKILNFGLIYGMGASSFAKASGVSREEAKEFIDAYFREFSRVRTWQEEVKARARTMGYTETLTGRRRYFFDIVSSSPQFAAEAERAALNHPIQGLAADIMKLAMIETREVLLKKGWWGKEVKMVLSIHDELLFEVADSIIKEAAAAIKDTMEKVYDLPVPLKTEVAVGKEWGNLHKMEIAIHD